MNLRQGALSAGRWTGASAACVTSIQLVQTMVLARLLSPGEFGLMAICVAITAIVSSIADAGTSRALIHFDALERRTLSTLYWINVGIAVSLAFLLALAAPLFGALFHSDRLTLVVQVSSMALPITAIGQQFRILAEKDLRFAPLGKIEILSAAIGACVAVVAGLMGAGVFSLVAGTLAVATCSSALAWIMLSEDRRPGLDLDWTGASEPLRYGAYLVGDTMTGTFSRQIDVFLGGAALGAASIGLYSVPRDLSSRVLTVFNPIVTRVGFPLMAKLKNDRTVLKELYLKTLRLTSSLNAPVYIAIAFFADGVIHILYGQQWIDAAFYLRLLAIWGLARSLGNPVGSLLYATGRARLAFWWNIAALLVSIPILYAGSRLGGLSGLAIATLSTQLFLLVFSWAYLVKPSCEATFSEFVKALGIPVSVGIASAAIAWGTAMLIAQQPVWHLAVGLLVGGIAYMGLSMAFNQPWVRLMRDLMAPLLRLRARTQ